MLKIILAIKYSVALIQVQNSSLCDHRTQYVPPPPPPFFCQKALAQAAPVFTSHIGGCGFNPLPRFSLVAVPKTRLGRSFSEEKNCIFTLSATNASCNDPSVVGGLLFVPRCSYAGKLHAMCVHPASYE